MDNTFVGKMLNITNQQVKPNQNHSKIPHHTVKISIIKDKIQHILVKM